MAASANAERLIDRDSPVSRADVNRDLSSKITILKVAFDDKPDPENKAVGTYIHITWQNDTGRPIREVTARLRITDDFGNPVSGAPDYIWLYADTNPLLPGKKHVTHDYVGGDPALGEPVPVHHNLSLDYATETLSDH